MPERITDQRHAVFARQSFIREKGAPAKGLNARNVEEVRGNFVGEWRDRLVERRKGTIGAYVCSHAFKAPAAVVPVEEKGGSGESPAITSQAAEIRPDDGETRGVA